MFGKMRKNREAQAASNLFKNFFENSAPFNLGKSLFETLSDDEYLCAYFVSLQIHFFSLSVGGLTKDESQHYVFELSSEFLGSGDETKAIFEKYGRDCSISRSSALQAVRESSLVSGLLFERLRPEIIRNDEAILMAREMARIDMDANPSMSVVPWALALHTIYIQNHLRSLDK